MTASSPPGNAAAAPFRIGHIQEPDLLFGGGSRHIDPKLGLSLFGPFTGRTNRTPDLATIRVGLVGTPDLVALGRAWLERCGTQIDTDGALPFSRPPFPGLNHQAPFRCSFAIQGPWDEVLPDRELAVATDRPTSERVARVAAVYVRAVQNIRERDSRPDVILLAIPDAVAASCDESGTAPRALRRRTVSAAPDHERGQGTLFDDAETADAVEKPATEAEPPLSDLRRAIKAMCMEFGIPTQIMRERSLRGSVATDAATRAWNFCSALLYKSGDAPWRLAELQQDTCYVGVSFFRDKWSANPAVRASLAQLFTQGGDGLVLRGEAFEWTDPRRSPHLDRDQAKRLIRQVLELYTRQTKRAPVRVVVFKSSQYWDEEKRGMLEALADIPRRDFVAVTFTDIRLMRQGKYPPLRGTCLSVSDDTHVLYTQGYVPLLRTYPGSGSPNPLEVKIEVGDTPADELMSEILGLTKVNWNTASFACHLPMTLNFARRVGEILGELPSSASPATEYRFFM